jgi:protein-tyrosine-phosphatase
VHSAGIIVAPQDPRTKTLYVLQSLGIDVSHHIQAQITPTVVDAYDLIIAMAIDHQQFVKEYFGRNIPLFNDIDIGEHNSVLEYERSFL